MDILCKCGHSKKIHKVPEEIRLANKRKIKFIPTACYLQNFLFPAKIEWACKCIKYIPDNLKTIEKLAEEKKLI